MTSSFDQQQHNYAALMTYTEFYRVLDASQLTKLSSVYHNDVQFINPVTQYQGLEAFGRYYGQLMHTIGQCRFEMEHWILRENQAGIFWRMFYTHPSLNNGQELALNGATHVRFLDSHVIYQQDYFDLGSMIYEHVPMMGSMVKSLKAKLSG